MPEADGALSTSQTKDAKYLLLLSSGPAFSTATEAATQLRTTSNNRVGCAHLAQLHPFPHAALTALFSEKKAITWLHPASSHYDMLANEIMQNLSAEQVKNGPEWFQGRLVAQPSTEVLMAVFQNMLPKGANKTNFCPGIEFTRPASDYPQHEILLQGIQRNFPEATQWGLQADTNPEEAPSRTDKPGTLPLTVHRQKDLGPPYSRAAHFYHNVAALHVENAFHELVADPFQAIPVTPAGTAAMAEHPPERTKLPVFKPENCTGCGECLVHCPHTALPPLAINIEQLLRGAMDIAGKGGTPLTQLTPLVKNLGKISGQVLLEMEEPVENVAAFLPEAFSRLAEQMKMPEEKREKISLQIEKLIEVLEPMPVAVSNTFFTRPEQQEKGSGELFTPRPRYPSLHGLWPMC